MIKDQPRGSHQGQQQNRLHQQAGHMTAPGHPSQTKKPLASRVPSTHDDVGFLLLGSIH